MSLSFPNAPKQSVSEYVIGSTVSGCICICRDKLVVVVVEFLFPTTVECAPVKSSSSSSSLSGDVVPSEDVVPSGDVVRSEDVVPIGDFVPSGDVVRSEDTVRSGDFVRSEDVRKL